MADVQSQGYLRVTSGARIIDGWGRCSLTGSSTEVAVCVSSVRVSNSQDVPTFAVIHQLHRDILNKSIKAEIRGCERGKGRGQVPLYQPVG